MTAHTWHAEPELLAAYAAGALDAVAGASVEQHVTRCAECRAAIGTLAETSALERTWSGIRDAVEAPPLPAPLRLAARLGLTEPTTVLLAATASLRSAWLASAFVALGFATAAVAWSGGQAIAPFLLVAPLVPVVGVAAAYGHRRDALETLVVTAPYGRTRLILVRTLAVLVSVLPFAVLLGYSLPGPTWVAVAWLGPALALLPVLLATASFVGPRPAAAVIALAWSGTVLLSLRIVPATWPVEPDRQLVYLGLAVASTLVLVGRARHRQMGEVL